MTLRQAQGERSPDDIDDKFVCSECGCELPDDGTRYLCDDCSYEDGFQ